MTSKPQRPVWPKVPADQHEVKWWTIDIHRSGSVLVEHRALYHEHTPWSALYEGAGADFVDSIQLFENDQFNGRHDTPGLRDYFADDKYNRLYASRSEAVSAARTAVSEAIARRRAEIIHYEKMHARLEDTP